MAAKPTCCLAAILTLATLKLGFGLEGELEAQVEGTSAVLSSAVSNVPSWASSEAYASLGSLYTSMTKVPAGRCKLVHNAWFHSGRFFALLQPQDMDNASVVDEGLAAAHMLCRVPCTDATRWASAAHTTFVPGVTLLLDFPFTGMQDHLGHWAELMAPLYSVLSERQWQQHTRCAQGGHSSPTSCTRPCNSTGDEPCASQQAVSRVVLGNLKASALIPWFLSSFQTVFTANPSTAPSLVLDSGQLSNAGSQRWVVFEELLVVNDRWTHPRNKRGFVGASHGNPWNHDTCQRYVGPSLATRFSSAQHAMTFRAAAWQAEGLFPPAAWDQGSPAPGWPRCITLLHEPDPLPGIANRAALLGLLVEIGQNYGLEVREVTLERTGSWSSHVQAVATSGVLVSRSSPLLSNVWLLPPGAMVLELLPYKWEWAGVSQFARNMSESMGDVHHFAWRPQSPENVVFKNTSDARYWTWTAEECAASECQEKMARADLIVDIPAIRSLLLEKVPGVLAGVPVHKLAAPWPAPM